MAGTTVIFDLDGTLLDTLEDLAAAVNHGLRACGYPEHATDLYRAFVGDGAAALVGRALPTDATADDERRVLAAFRKAYQRGYAERSRPYRGIPELLGELRRRGIATAVLSNKPQPFTELCVHRLLGRHRFDIVHGARPGVPRKPVPVSARAVAAALGCAPWEPVYVGDSATDMRTARSAGMRAYGASWGFRGCAELLATGADAILPQPMALLERLPSRPVHARERFS